jgi:hypothetical protein
MIADVLPAAIESRSSGEVRSSMNTDRVCASRLDPDTTAATITAANLVIMLITSSFLESARRHRAAVASLAHKKSARRNCGRI